MLSSLCLFFLFRFVFNNFFTIPLDNENARLKLALAIPIGAPITVANNIEMNRKKCYRLLQIKQSKMYQNKNKQYI